MEATARFVVYLAVTGVPNGPKLDPNTDTHWEPALAPPTAPGPLNDDTTGRPYDVGPTRTGAACPPTTTLQYKDGPKPGDVIHRIWEPLEAAANTVQLVAVYALGLHCRATGMETQIQCTAVKARHDKATKHEIPLSMLQRSHTYTRARYTSRLMSAV